MSGHSLLSRPHRPENHESSAQQWAVLQDENQTARRSLVEPPPGELPQHCGLKEAKCNGLQVANIRQRRFIKLYSKLTMSPEPGVFLCALLP